VAEDSITLLCVDDHRLMREGIVRIIELEKGLKVVAEAATGEEAVAQFLAAKPDVVLMDLLLRGMNGLQAIRAIRQADPTAKIIVLTMYEGDEDIYHALQAGAMGYLLKDSVSQDLLRVIREVSQGKRSIPPQLAAKYESRINQRTLSTRELEVLELLAKGQRNKEISMTLGISEETVRAHLKNILNKLNVRDRTAALTEALRRGILRLEHGA
jgi:two-component system NarL family response regulator